jgi:hypothetical protein
MRGGGTVAAVALLLAACSDGEPNLAGNAATNAAASRFADRMAGTPPPAPPASPFKSEDKSTLLEFSYAYPAQAAAIPFLVDKFGKDMARSKADATAMARDDRKAAQESGFPFHAHSLETEWSVSADTPRFLALQSHTYAFTGGAHGMTGYGALLWDKARKRETSVKALMTAPQAFNAALRPRFCATLDQQRAEKRGEPVVRGDDPFTDCIDPMSETIVPTSKDGKLIDSFTVVVGPYSAGPYAEGAYEVPVPIDAALRAAIKTEYQDAFVKP